MKYAVVLFLNSLIVSYLKLLLVTIVYSYFVTTLYGITTFYILLKFNNVVKLLLMHWWYVCFYFCVLLLIFSLFTFTCMSSTNINIELTNWKPAPFQRGLTRKSFVIVYKNYKNRYLSAIRAVVFVVVCVVCNLLTFKNAIAFCRGMHKWYWIGLDRFCINIWWVGSFHY